MRAARLLGVAFIAACAAQSCRYPKETIDCDSKDDCTASPRGLCEADGRCSYPDESCGPGGRRYGAYSTGQGQCVSSGDGGADDSGGSGGSGGASGSGGSGGKFASAGGRTADAAVDGGERRPGHLSVVAGRIGGEGSIDGRGSQARFMSPGGVAFDGERFLYVADALGNTVRRIDTHTASVTTIAGYPDAAGYEDGSAADARFDGPESVTFDATAPDGASLYVTEWSGHRLRKVNLDLGTVTTIAGSPAGAAGFKDGIGKDASFSLPEDTARGPGTLLYLADGMNNAIRTVDVTTGEVKTIAGDAVMGASGAVDGPVAAARFEHPYGIVFDEAHNRLFISEFEGDRVRVLDLTAGVVSTLVSTGVSGGASMYYDAPRDRLIAAAFYENRVVAIDVALKTVTPLVLQPGPGFELHPEKGVDFSNPTGIAEVNGGFFVSDFSDSTVRRLVPAVGGAYETTHFAGLRGHTARVDGKGEDARFSHPGAALLAADSRTIYVVDEYSDVIRAVDLTTRSVITYAGDASHATLDGVGPAAKFQGPRAITRGAEAEKPYFYVSEERGVVRKIDPGTAQVTTLFAGNDELPAWAALAATPDVLYASDDEAHVIVQMPFAAPAPATLVGVRGESGCEDGPFSLARFGEPSGLLWDGEGALFVADGECKTIRRVDLARKVVETVAGGGPAGAHDGKGTRARFTEPLYLAWARGGLGFYVGDGHVVRHVDEKTFAVTTFAGSPDDFGGVWLPPAPPRLNRPNGLVEGPGGELYVTSENALLRFDPE